MSAPEPPVAPDPAFAPAAQLTPPSIEPDVAASDAALSKTGPVAALVPAPLPAGTDGPVQVVGRALSVAAENVSHAVQPRAALAVATEFGFPLGLAVAVLGYLGVQGYVDRRDPKLRLAPSTTQDGLVAFRAEAEL